MRMTTIAFLNDFEEYKIINFLGKKIGCRPNFLAISRLAVKVVVQSSGLTKRPSRPSSNGPVFY